MSRSAAISYLKQLQSRLNYLKNSLPDGLEAAELEKVLDTIFRIENLVLQGEQVLAHDDPRHPGL